VQKTLQRIQSSSRQSLGIKDAIAYGTSLADRIYIQTCNPRHLFHRHPIRQQVPCRL
jgi:hypothetical protein